MLINYLKLGLNYSVDNNVLSKTSDIKLGSTGKTHWMTELVIKQILATSFAF